MNHIVCFLFGPIFGYHEIKEHIEEICKKGGYSLRVTMSLGDLTRITKANLMIVDGRLIISSKSLSYCAKSADVVVVIDSLDVCRRLCLAENHSNVIFANADWSPIDFAIAEAIKRLHP